MSYTCPKCGLISHNPTDEREKYCLRCHVFEDALYVAIIHGIEPPLPEPYQAGQAARSADAPFHAGPQPFQTVAALSWRIGWNDRALELNWKTMKGRP